MSAVATCSCWGDVLLGMVSHTGVRVSWMYMLGSWGLISGTIRRGRREQTHTRRQNCVVARLQQIVHRERAAECARAPQVCHARPCVPRAARGREHVA